MTITATIIKDSISQNGNRLTTFELRYPRFIHSEFMTHRVFARNASSSRAIPIQTLCEEIRKDPAMPSAWGLNGKGMQDHGLLSKKGAELAKEKWLKARDYALLVVGEMINLGEPPHKQIVNRLIEPFAHINVVVTATDYTNFFALRRHKDADPTIYDLADKMWAEYKSSIPEVLNENQWHLPYVDVELDSEAVLQYLYKEEPEVFEDKELLDERILSLYTTISVARCARVSYKTRGTTERQERSKLGQDIFLYSSLLKSEPLHASPAEHQAIPDIIVSGDTLGTVKWANKKEHGPFTGWRQYRKMLPNENITTYTGA